MAATMANEFIDDFRRKLKYRVLFSVMQMQIDHVWVPHRKMTE